MSRPPFDLVVHPGTRTVRVSGPLDRETVCVLEATVRPLLEAGGPVLIDAAGADPLGPDALETLAALRTGAEASGTVLIVLTVVPQARHSRAGASVAR